MIAESRLPPVTRTCRGLIRTVLALQAILSIVGCAKGEPKGQVIATIDGVELTLSELNMEARVRHLPIASDRSLRRALTAELVDRKLLVRAARARKLDATPDFILMQRRANEILLAQQLLATTVSELGPAKDAGVERHRTAEPADARDETIANRADLASARVALERQRLERAMSILLTKERRDAKVELQDNFK